MMEIKKINSHAVERNSWILFSLSYFLENILEPKSSKMPPTSTFGVIPRNHVIVKSLQKFSKIHSSRTAYSKFYLKRL